MIAIPRGRRWLAPEVVQTSSMDCGPAALKCLLAGHGIEASYGRLREACQTSVDGTSIDAIEAVAQQLGVPAEQVMVPRDFLCLEDATNLPALVVVRHAEHFTHFVVVWARHGDWLQVMDPAVGRRWVSCARFEAEIFAHDQAVDARDWRAWCDSEDCRAPLRRQMAALGIGDAMAQEIIAIAQGDEGWFSFGALDAAVRLAAALVAAGGIRKGAEAGRTVAVLMADTRASGHDIFAVIPQGYWSAIPDIGNTDPTREMLRIRGGVMLRAGAAGVQRSLPEELPTELAAAVRAPDEAPWRRIWSMLRADGSVRPGLLLGAVAVQALAVLAQALLMRGLLELAQLVALPIQRLAALAALLVLLAAAGLLDMALAAQAIRLGRWLELRLRRALLARLPLLDDRYFQSRPITDMADRSHMIHAVRALPPLLVQALQAVAGLVLTFLAIVLIAPDCAGPALLAVIVAMALPLLFQPLFNERDLRVRNHGGALHGFYLDALLGLAPIRSHGAQRAIARQHESLLVEWAGAAKGLARWTLASEGLQGLLCTGLVGWMLLRHFLAAGHVVGTDLLLVFWALQLPALAEAVAGTARRYPPIRSAFLRQMEPLERDDINCGPVSVDKAHDTDVAREREPAIAHPLTGPAVAIAITGGEVLAGGHAILREIDLAIAPGEHVAVVGRSGAGKSSLIGLLLGWHRPERGEISVDGRPLGAAELAGLRRQTAWVDPQVQLWNRSLLDNLAYAAPDGDLGRLSAVLAGSALAEIAGRLPQGLQSPLGEGGGLLSGGEGQRVRLGRALLPSAARLVLLDEPFRGLDRTQRGALLKAARETWREQTLLCATHDIAETLQFPRVLVIEDGRIVEDGAPADLARRNSRLAALLEAERGMLAKRWRGAMWRRWRVGGGIIAEGPMAEAA